MDGWHNNARLLPRGNHFDSRLSKRSPLHREGQLKMAGTEHHEAVSGGDKHKKYDRQLRLWGDHGQAALETAKVCLINATAVGTEILKNLVLPGVGAFTIVDGNIVKGEDVGSNFFLDKDSIGKPRAQVATELLVELNEDVNGDYIDEDPDKLLENNGSFFSNFSLVIATSVGEKTLLKLSSLLWDQEVPLMICRSYGFIGSIRLSAREHIVVESHPDNAHEDLRLDNPFPGLVAFCDSLDLDSMNKKDHSHTPWLVVVYKYVQLWKEQHGGELPKNWKEKSLLKEMIRSGIRRNAENVPEDEENFEEGIRSVNSALVPSRIPATVQEIFGDDACKNIHSESKPFWILARALKEFVENEGQGLLPVRGSIPDMTADSERYIQLQNIYREQASQDMAAVTQHLMTILQGIGRESLLNVEYRSQYSPPRTNQDGISESEIKKFCKNAAFLRLIRCRSFEEEYDVSTSKIQQMAHQLEDEDSDFVHYIMLRAVDRFHMEYNRYPGYYDDAIDGDIPKLKACVGKLLQEWSVQNNVRDEYVQEYVRYGACELPSIAAFIGGAAAQEAIKVLTNQFVPINNMFIYNANKQTSVTLLM